jgi:hypothetical protein
MTTLISRPEDPTTRTLLALDVDGVVNRFNDDQGPSRVLVRTAHGAKFWIDFDPAIIQALDTVIRDCDIQLGWDTTWGPNVRALIEQAFDGLLRDGFVLCQMPARYRGAIPADWKLSGLRRRVAQTSQPWVWVDDDAIDMARYDGTFTEASVHPTAPGLLIPTNPVTGITFAEIESIREFATKHNEAAGSA